jgi:hypothetical protein
MHHDDYDYVDNYMEQSASYEASSLSVNQEMLQSFMKPVGSLPCSQEPATKPYSEPYESSPQPQIPFLRKSSPCYPTTYGYIFQMASCPYVF